MKMTLRRLALFLGLLGFLGNAVFLAFLDANLLWPHLLGAAWGALLSSLLLAELGLQRDIE